MSNVEIMSVQFELLDNDLPGITFCSDFTVPITNKTFVASYISYYENDLRFKINNLHDSRLKFEIEDEENGIIKVYFKKDFMGYTLMGEVYNVFIKCYKQILENKEQTYE